MFVWVFFSTLVNLFLYDIDLPRVGKYRCPSRADFTVQVFPQLEELEATVLREVAAGTCGAINTTAGISTEAATPGDSTNCLKAFRARHTQLASVVHHHESNTPMPFNLKRSVLKGSNVSTCKRNFTGPQKPFCPVYCVARWPSGSDAGLAINWSQVRILDTRCRVQPWASC